jgi:hypothetical protein
VDRKREANLVDQFCLFRVVFRSLKLIEQRLHLAVLIHQEGEPKGLAHAPPVITFHHRRARGRLAPRRLGRRHVPPPSMRGKSAMTLTCSRRRDDDDQPDLAWFDLGLAA